MMAILLFTFGVIILPQCILGDHIALFERTANTDNAKGLNLLSQKIHTASERVRRNNFEFDMGQGSRNSVNHQLLQHHRASLIAQDPWGPGKRKRSRVNLPLLYKYFINRERDRFTPN